MTDIYFRTDGNHEIATGHLMRCLAIARACAQKGANVKFIVSDEESLTLLQERLTASQEFGICCLNRCYKDLHEEIPALLSCLASDTAEKQSTPDVKQWIFIDSYYASTPYFEALRKYFRVAYIDDLQSFDCAVDLVINYDSDESSNCYANASRRLLGAQYTPLRQQFRAPSYQVRPAVKHVLLSTGGTDPYRVAESLLQAIFGKNDFSTSTLNMQVVSSFVQDMPALRSLHYHVLTSRTNSRYDALDALAQTHPSIHIHTNVTEVAALMASCDLAVSAGGTTLCELCAVGVPSVSYLMAENQRTAVETYAKKKLIPCAGDIRPVGCTADSATPKADTVNLPDQGKADFDLLNYPTLLRILDFLSTMAQNHTARVKISTAMRNYLDGTGAEQIAQALLP